MKTRCITRTAAILWFIAAAWTCPLSLAQDAPVPPTVESLEKVLGSVKGESSAARQRLTVRRAIRDAESLLPARANTPERFVVLGFIFRAQQQLLALDDDAKNRQDLLGTCRELVKAPDDMASLRLEADLLLSQAEISKQGADNAARANALLPFVQRYVETPEGPKVLRMAMVMALELGESRVVTALHELIEKHCAGDLEMINFQRDKLGGQVLGAPFCGTFERADGAKIHFPMDGLGRTTLLVFWSKEGTGSQFLKGLSTAVLEKKNVMAGRIEIVSFNLDELPDAGESMVRGLGVDWQVLRLPGGRENPVYKAYSRSNPRILTVSPTGCTALIMSGTAKLRVDPSGNADFTGMFDSTLAREWTNARYCTQIASLTAGDFLVLDPEGGINPTLPPELKATANDGEAKPLAAGAASVPDETLRAIQECFVAPPLRYRLTQPEALASYGKAIELCRKTIAGHSAATNLWIVRNRLIIALMGLWKTNSDVKSLEAAIVEAKAAMAAGYPAGCDVIARFCLARGKLRDSAAYPRKTLNGFIAECGGENAPGPAIAAASLLALDAADRGSFERYRQQILAKHTEHPMMWTYSAFLLDRYHDYWLFRMPFTSGWSYARQQEYFMARGDTEDARRMLRVELPRDDGKPLRIPEDLDKQWTVILFSHPAPWPGKAGDGLPQSPLSAWNGMRKFADSRPANDVKVVLATLGGDAAATRAATVAGESATDFPVCSIPGGLNHPLVQRLGLLSEDSAINLVLVDKNGRIALMCSGLGENGEIAIPNAIMHEDEMAVSAALERGEVQATKERIFALVPPDDPNAVDAKDNKIKKPLHSLAHLRSRARVYMALKEYDKALADAEEVVQRQLGTDGRMSLRTQELDVSEALRDSILKLRKQ